MDETTILKELAKGSQKSMQAIYDEYYILLCKIAHLRLNDQSQARDTVQELMLDIWKRRETIQIKGSLKAYLIQSLIYKTSRANQKNKISSEFHLPNIEHNTPNDQLEYEELRNRVNMIINEMPERAKECFLMSRNEGLKYKEIASKLDISHKTVDHHISKALRILKEKLNIFNT